MIAMVVIFRDKIRRSQPSDNRSDNPSHAFFSKALLNRERVRYNRNGAGIFLDYFLPNMSDNINYVVNSKMPSFPTGQPFPSGPGKGSHQKTALLVFDGFPKVDLDQLDVESSHLRTGDQHRRLTIGHLQVLANEQPR